VSRAQTGTSRFSQRTTAVLAIAGRLAAVFTLTVVAPAACADEQSKFDYLRIQVDGQPTLAISKHDVLTRGIVVLFHGQDEDEYVLTADTVHTAMTQKLVDAGFAVVASHAGGNAFTAVATVRNYRELASVAMQHYRIENIYFLAVSTGAVAAVNLLAAGYTPVRGMAAISPVLDVHHTAGWPASFATGYPPAGAAESANPVDLPAGTLAGTNMRFYVVDTDPVARTDVNAAAFEHKFGAVANISVVGCAGGHADPSCYQPDDVIRWFTKLDQRRKP